ncbi:sensor histidine kinase [Pseudomonas yamanorum]|uniref:sensor histidine kinase n=1 Tax=Pseudomonas yamanorum TaxID=515393 RepID=UPI003D36BE09
MSDEYLELEGFDFEELAENAPVMIWRAKTDQTCDWFNKPWREFSGKGLEELYGAGWMQDVHPDDYEMCRGIFTNAFEVCELFSVPHRMRRKDGVYRWFLNNGTPYFREGVFSGFFGTCIDITDEKEMEAHQKVLLGELNHRVKNNLQLIISFMQISLLKAEGDEAKVLMRDAITRVQGVGVVQAELHKTGSAKIDLAVYLPNLARAALLAETGSSSTLEVDVKSVHVSMSFASDIGLIVNELIINTVKHGSSHDSVVRLAIHPLANDQVELVVADHGVGFDPEQLGVRRTKGSRLRGLGLVDALAARCKARITRENAEGAVIRIQFPRPAVPS